MSLVKSQIPDGFATIRTRGLHRSKSRSDQYQKARSSVSIKSGGSGPLYENNNDLYYKKKNNTKTTSSSSILASELIEPIKIKNSRIHMNTVVVLDDEDDDVLEDVLTSDGGVVIVDDDDVEPDQDGLIGLDDLNGDINDCYNNDFYSLPASTYETFKPTLSHKHNSSNYLRQSTEYFDSLPYDYMLPPLKSPQYINELNNIKSKTFTAVASSNTAAATAPGGVGGVLNNNNYDKQHISLYSRPDSPRYGKISLYSSNNSNNSIITTTSNSNIINSNSNMNGYAGSGSSNNRSTTPESSGSNSSTCSSHHQLHHHHHHHHNNNNSNLHKPLIPNANNLTSYQITKYVNENSLKMLTSKPPIKSAAALQYRKSFSHPAPPRIIYEETMALHNGCHNGTDASNKLLATSTIGISAGSAGGGGGGSQQNGISNGCPNPSATPNTNVDYNRIHKNASAELLNLDLTSKSVGYKKRYATLGYPKEKQHHHHQHPLHHNQLEKSTSSLNDNDLDHWDPLDNKIGCQTTLRSKPRIPWYELAIKKENRQSCPPFQVINL